jgi:selenocysteine lyase/cysteine desulfurase
VATATDEVTQAFVERGSLAIDEYDERAETVRGKAAELMGVSAGDVAFVKNTTEGLGFVASGIDWQPGDRVIVPDGEFPSTIYPWLALEARGVLVERVAPVGTAGSLPLEAFVEALDRGPARLVACSWVQFNSGWRTDLAALAAACHDHGALLCADVIQGLGVVPAALAEWGVDFAAADAHKWLLGPQGVGVLYVAPDQRDALRVLEPGWNSVAHRQEWDNLDYILDDSARRFEGGSLNLTGIMALGASIDLLAAAGVDHIWTHVEELCRQAAVGLSDLGATIVSDRSSDCRSAILTVSLPDHDAQSLCDELEGRDIICAPRGGGIRISPHGYNTADDIQRLIDAVAEIAPPPAAPTQPDAPVDQGPMRRPRDW